MSHVSASSTVSTALPPPSVASASAPAARAAISRETSTPRHVAIAPESLAPLQGPELAAAVRGWTAALGASIEGCLLEGVEQVSVRAWAPGEWAAHRELHRQLTEWIETQAPRLVLSGVHFRLFGQAADEIRDLRAVLDGISEQAARDRDARLYVNLGLGYDGRAELAEAARALALAPRASASPADALRLHIGSADLPSVDLLIRTGAQTRLSDFLLWQSAYAELLFVDAPWIGFEREHLAQALADYARRRRTFGGLENRIQ